MMTPIPELTAAALVRGAYNCLMYALDDINGEKGTRKIFDKYFLSDSTPNGSISFEKTANDIGLAVTKVSQLSKANIAIAWWMDRQEDAKDDGYISESPQYHVIRKRNNEWWQKPDYREPPAKLLPNELQAWESGGDDSLSIAYYLVDF